MTDKPKSADEALAEIKAARAPGPSSVPAPVAPAVPARKRFLVKLDGCPVLYVDKEGRQQRKDGLEVEAVDRDEAWTKFCQHNGILASKTVPEINELAGAQQG